jgi:hypothetical protein
MIAEPMLIPNTYEHYLNNLPYIRQVGMLSVQEHVNFSFDVSRFKGEVVYAIPCRDGTVYIMILPD